MIFSENIIHTQKARAVCRAAKRLIAVDVFCSLIIAASNAVLPVIVRHATNSDAITVRFVAAVSLIYIEVIAAMAIANFYCVRIGTLFATRLDLRGNICGVYMDAIHYHVSSKGYIVKKAVYIAIEIK